MAPKPFFEFPQARRLRPPNPPFDPVSRLFSLVLTQDQSMRNLNPRVWVRQITVSFNVLPLYAYPNPLTNQSFPAPRRLIFDPNYLAWGAIIVPAGAGMPGFRDRLRKVIRRLAHASPWRRP